MSKNIQISVITACYNHGRYVTEMIDSVLAQTLAGFEIIIVNDGSTDDTKTILDKVRHEKIKIIHSENRGPAAARNLAISNSSAPVIMNLDADDKISPTLLKKAVEVFEKNQNAGIVYSDAECFGARTGKFETGDYTLDSMLFDNRIISQAFFRKSDWESVGGYSGKFIYGLEDWDFWLRIIELNRDVIKIPEALVLYRTYNELNDCRSGRRKNNRLKMAKSQIMIFDEHKDLYLKSAKAFKYFSELKNEIENESQIIRLIRNAIYRLRKSSFYK